MTRAFPYETCVITGAASGIGRALALELGRRGCRLALCDVDEDGLSRTVADTGSADVLTRVVDVGDRDAMHDFADASFGAFGRVDAVFNNAGVTVQQTLLETSYEDYEWILRINFWGVLHGTKAFLPPMVERGFGAIVNVSSVFGLIGMPTQSAYNASKFAVRGLTEALRHELRDTGVVVTCVHPGGVRTNIVRRGRFYRDIEGGTSHRDAIRDFDQIARTTPDDAARQILEGVERGRSRILVGADARFIDGVQRLLPVRYGALIDSTLKLLRR